MDHTEDLSARILLRNILSTEPPRTPITRSAAAAAQVTTDTRLSGRLSRTHAGVKTPQDILRRGLRKKIRESIARKSLPAPARRTTSGSVKKINTPAPASVLFDDGDTPRHILRNILQTEPVKSPVVHEKAASEEPQLPSANLSITTKRPSIELSGLDLPDLTIGNAASTAKGLSRKRPHRTLNVTAFEKRLKGGSDVDEKNDGSDGDYSSLSMSSLKTPFVDPRTEKRGLQRMVSNRRKITEEEFGAAVNNRQMGHDSGARIFLPVGLSDTTCFEGFTLSLSQHNEPNITTDIVNCNTALYTHHDSLTSSFSIVATQDKPTVMASQLQKQMIDMEQSKLGKEESLYLFPTKEDVVAEPQNEECVSEGQAQEGVDIAESQKEDWKSTAESEEDRMEAQTEEEGTADSQFEGEGEGGVDSQSEEDIELESAYKEEEVAPRNQNEAEREKHVADFHSEKDGEAETQSGAEGDPEEYQCGEKDPAANSQYEEHADERDWRQEEEEEEKGEQAMEPLEYNMEHISRRAHRSEVGLIMPITEEGGYLPDTTETGKPEAQSAVDLQSSLEMRSLPHVNVPQDDLDECSSQGQKDASGATAESDANHPLEVTHDIVDTNYLSEAAIANLVEEEESEDDRDSEESDEFLCKTPAFVREKMTFFNPEPLTSSSVLRDIKTSNTSETLPAAKPKKVQQRKRTPVKKEPSLPKNYLMGAFRHFAKTKVSTDVYPVLNEIMDKFFDRLSDDLETYAGHAKRKTIEVEDAVLLLKRQGFVNDKVPVEVLIEKYLRMEQRKLLIPIATSGNVVIPKKRR